MPVDVDHPGTWVKFKPALCNGCRAGCCTFPVPVDAEDLFHMGYVKAEEVNGPLTKVAVRLRKLGIIQSYSPKKRSFVLAQKNIRDCIFLNRQRRCSIYANRPAVCRGFPFNGARPGYCPNQKKK